MQLYKHQQRIVDLNPDRILLNWACGTGKSIAAIMLANKKDGMNVLIVCPKSVKQKWQREVKAFGDTRKNWLVITKEEFRRDYQKIGRYDTVINDEVHFFSSLTSQMSKAFAKYLKVYDVKYRIFLTATSYMSTPWNIYMLAKHLGRDWNYISFRRKFFYDVVIGGRPVPMVKSGIEPEIARLVASIGDIVKIEEAMDLPEQIYREEYFDLNPNQKREITLIHKTEYNPVVKYTKIHQIINGTMKGDGYTEDRTFPYEKAGRIMEYCETTDKVAVVCRYNLQIKTLAKLIEEKIPDRKVFIITGETKDRDQVTRDIDAIDKCVVLIGASVSEGYELPSVNLIIFASLDFSYKNYSQLCGRFLRINRPTKNVYIHMIVKDTIDEAVYKSMLEKKEFDIQIYAQNNLKA